MKPLRHNLARVSRRLLPAVSRSPLFGSALPWLSWRRIRQSSTVLGLVLSLALPLFAQGADPLMPEGAYSTTVKAGLAAGETRTYYLNAVKGQQLTVRLVSPGDSGCLKLSDSEGVSLPDDVPASVQIRSLDLIVPRSGIYSLEVSASSGALSYLLEVTLDDPPEPLEESLNP